MTQQSQELPCPAEDCNATIPFDTNQLMMGVQFICPNCNAKIGLASESKPLVAETMKKFTAIKDSLAR